MIGSLLTGTENIIEKLITNGAIVEAKNSDGFTSLHVAAKYGNEFGIINAYPYKIF